MIFVYPDIIETIWNTIIKKVMNGELGCSSKVANGLNNDGSSSYDKYLICVYVDDFRDETIVRRMLRSLLRIKGVYITSGFKVGFGSCCNLEVFFSDLFDSLDLSMSQPHSSLNYLYSLISSRAFTCSVFR